MASKKPGKLESDDSWDIDGDLDMPDFNFDAVDPPDNRNPTTKIATSFAQGAKDTVLSGGFLRQRIKNDLPKGYGKGLDMVDQGASTLRQLYNTGAKEAAPMISDMKRLTKRMMPTIERFTPKSAADKIRAWSEEQKKGAGPSAEEIRESGLQSQLGAIFEAQAKERDDQKVEKEARDTIREQISQVRHRDQISQLDAIRQSTSALQQYQDKITSQWQRKSLELQYRHYFVAMDALEEQKKQNVTTTEHLANIAKNTALPEYVKITQSERVAEILRSKFIGGMADSIFDKRRGFMRNFQKNLINEAQRRVRDFSDNVRNGFAMADSMLDMQEMQAEMGGGPSAGQLAGSMAGGMVADSLGARLGRWGGGLAKKNKTIRKWGNKFAYTGENLPQMAWQFAKSDHLDDTPLIGGLFRMLKDAAGNGNADYSMHRDEAKDMQGPSIFSNQTRKTINEVIPGFLAKIYQELQIMRTGDASIDLVRYDFSKNKFSSEGDSRMATFNSLFSRSDIDSHREDVEKLLNNLDPENTKLSPEARAALGSFLFRDNMSNNEGSAKRLTDFDTYTGSAGKHADELAGFFTEYFKGDDEGSRKLQFTQQFNQLGRGLSDTREKIQMYMNLGMEDQLRDMGVIDEYGNVDQRRMLQYWNDEDTYKYQGGGPGGRARKFKGRGGRPLPPPPPFPNLPPPTPPGGGGGSGGGFKDDCCEELKKAINETSAKGPAEKMVEILTRIEEGLKAGVNLNITDQDADPNSPRARKHKRLLDWTFGDGVNAAGDGIKWGWGKGSALSKRVWGGAWSNAMKLKGHASSLFGKGKDWAKGKIDDLSDVYVELDGKVRPLLTSYKLRAGKYVDEATGQVISKWSEATGAIRDTETGELISVEQMKDAFSKTKYGKALFEKVKDLKDWGVDKLTKGYKFAGSVYGAGWELAKKAYDLLDRPCDVYVAGQEEPVLLAVTMKGGGYWSKTNGHAITKPSLIDGPVVNENKEEILTEEMLRQGLYDQFGVPLKTGWKKIAQYALTGIQKGWEKIKGLGKWAKDKASGLWNGGLDGIRDWWGNVTGPDGILIAGGSKISNVLIDIYNLLDARLPGSPTGLHAGDGSPGGGKDGGVAAGAARLRDGIKNRFKEAKVEEKVAKAKKKLELWGDRARKVVGDATGDGIRDGSLKDQALKAKELAKEKALSGADALRSGGKDAYGAVGGALGALLERFQKKEDEEESDGGDTNIDLSRDGGGDEKDKKDEKKNKRRPGESRKQYRERLKADRLRRKAVRDRYNRMHKVGRLGKAAQTGRAAANGLGRGALALGRGALMGTALLGEGAIATAATLGSAALTGTAAAASAIGSGAMWLGSAAMGFLSAPVVLGALAVGGLAVGAYYGYKYLTKKRLKPLNTVRYAQYGFLAADEDHLQAVMGLEDQVKKGLKFEGDVATLSMEGLDVKSMTESFGVNLKDKAAVNSWFFWFRDRFKPVYLTAQTAIRRTKRDVDLDDADSKLSPTEKQTYLNLAKFLEGPYSVTYNPFSAKEPLKAGYQEVKTAIDLAQASIEKELKDKPASGAEKAAQAAVLGKGVASAAEMKTAETERLGKDKIATAEREARAKQMQNNRMLIGGGMGMTGAMAFKGESLPKSRIAGGRIDALTCVRYKTYGLKEMELPRVRAMDSLEEAIEKDLDFSGDGIAVWKGDPKAMLAAQGGSFGIDGLANVKAYDWLTWFNYRFLPAYLNYATAMFRNTNRKKPSQGLHAMKPAQAVDIATIIYTTTSKYDSRGMSVWSVVKSPWSDYELNSDVKSVDDNMKALKDAAKAAVLGETKGRIDAATLAKPENALLAKVQKQYGKTEQIDFNKNPSVLMANVEKGRGMMAANSGFAGGLVGAQGMGYSMIPGGTGSFNGGTQVQHPGGGTGGDINTLPASQQKGWKSMGPIIMGAAKMAGFDPNLMASIAAAESGFDPNVGAGTSSAVGLFQFLTKDKPGKDSTWTAMLKKYGKKYGIAPGTPATDARANALMGAEYMKENLNILKGRLGRPITDTDIYMAHFLGAGGATKFLKANPNSVSTQIFPVEAESNAPVFYHDPKTRTRPKTLGEIYQHYTNLIKTRKAQFGVPSSLGGSAPATPEGMPAANDPSASAPQQTTSTGAAGSSVPPLLAPMAPGGGSKGPAAMPDLMGKGPTVEQAKAAYANQTPTKAGLDAAAAGRAATEAAMAEDTPKPKAPAAMPNAFNVATRNIAPAPAVVAASAAKPDKAAPGPSAMPQDDDRSVQGFLPPGSSPRSSGTTSDGAKSADIDKLGATVAAGNDFAKTQVELLRELVGAVKDLKTGLKQPTSSTVPTQQRAQGQMPTPPISLRRAQ